MIMNKYDLNKILRELEANLFTDYCLRFPIFTKQERLWLFI